MFFLGVFPDVELLWKLNGILPFTYFLILKSYLADRPEYGSSQSLLYESDENSGQSPRSVTVLGIYCHPETSTLTYAYETAILFSLKYLHFKKIQLIISYDF